MANGCRVSIGHFHIGEAMREVMGEWLQQFTCPKCGSIGAGRPRANSFPKCHKCKYAVDMMPSINGVIVENPINYNAKCISIINNQRATRKDHRNV